MRPPAAGPARTAPPGADSRRARTKAAPRTRVLSRGGQAPEGPRRKRLRGASGSSWRRRLYHVQSRFPGRGRLQENDGGRIAGRFETEARAFKESPFHSDPGRLRSLLDFAGVAAGEEALDIACGPGIVAAGLRERGASVTAIDLTPAM